jgi:hypothetical protein
VELYNRIEFGTVDSDILIAASAVNDVVRLLAELLDNATRFSPPNTIVVAEARRIRDYVLIQVEDRGLGIGEEQLETLNRRLAEPPPVDVDVAAFRLMGLAVVARLAIRYGIRVELRHNSEGGTVAHVSLPGSILILPQHRGREPLSMPPPRMPRAVGAPYVGNGHGGWSEAAKPALPTRSAAATLTDPWAPPRPGWDAPPDPPPLANQVTAAHPTTTHGQATAGYGDLSGAGYVPASPARAEEMPIFREMEASWFRAHNTANLEPWAMPTAGHPPPPPPPSAATVTASEPYQVGVGAYGAPASATPTMAGRPPMAAYGGQPPMSAYGGQPPMSAYGGQPPMAAQVSPAAPPVAASPPPPAPPPTVTPVSPASPRTARTAGGGFGGGGGGYSGGPGSGADVPRPAAPPVPPYASPEPPADQNATTPRQPGEPGWQTRADEGWRLASEAAMPMAGGTTRSGLPKRVPQAQLVPGGVETSSGRDRTRRTPDEVRGLLSAYHRGVQRGRSAGGDGDAADHSQTKENRG